MWSNIQTHLDFWIQWVVTPWIILLFSFFRINKWRKKKYTNKETELDMLTFASFVLGIINSLILFGVLVFFPFAILFGDI